MSEVVAAKASVASAHRVPDIVRTINVTAEACGEQRLVGGESIAMHGCCSPADWELRERAPWMWRVRLSFPTMRPLLRLGQPPRRGAASDEQ